MRRGRTVTLIVFAAALVAGAAVLPDYQRGAALVVDAAGIRGWPSQIARINAHAFRATPESVSSRHGPLAARTYQPESESRRAVVLVPGVHAGSIDGPRLVGFAQDLATRGLTVTTVELPDLKRYTITPRTTDMIEDAVRWMAARRDLSNGQPVGLMGISFGGGLAIAAAGREGIRDRLAFALAFGGHGDLPRTLRFLCTGQLPDGSRRPPHDYGVVIVLLGVASRVVPPEQVEPLRKGIRLFLEASHVDMVDKPRAATLFRQAVEFASSLPEPAATYMRYVNTRDVKSLGPRLLPHLGAMASDPALSPERSTAPAAPVYLLHGTDDNVIPAVESRLLAEHLQRSTRVHVLLSSLITHAEVDRPADVGEVWKLVAFWTSLLDQ